MAAYNNHTHTYVCMCVLCARKSSHWLKASWVKQGYLICDAYIETFRLADLQQSERIESHHSSRHQLSSHRNALPEQEERAWLSVSMMEVQMLLHLGRQTWIEIHKVQRRVKLDSKILQL